jgi:hypothetical protein
MNARRTWLGIYSPDDRIKSETPQSGTRGSGVSGVEGDDVLPPVVAAGVERPPGPHLP